MQAALMLRSKSRVARRRKLRKLGGRLELPSNVATKEIAPFPRYPPESWCAQGRAAWLERGRRCSVQEAQQQATCHRRWVKRNRIQDASLGGSSDDDDFLGVLRGPSTFANAFLYVGLGTIALGLVIAFVGTGEKGFKTVELRLIGPSLIGIGFICCMLRILFCICPSHCIANSKSARKKNGNKVDADHTTSLLRGESKRVSIARGPGQHPRYPITHKRSNSKMLNDGMEALRQIATTSLFMQNEQKPMSNRIVPIIKEPEVANEKCEPHEKSASSSSNVCKKNLNITPSDSIGQVRNSANVGNDRDITSTAVSKAHPVKHEDNDNCAPAISGFSNKLSRQRISVHQQNPTTTQLLSHQQSISFSDESNSQQVETSLMFVRNPLLEKEMRPPLVSATSVALSQTSCALPAHLLPPNTSQIPPVHASNLLASTVEPKTSTISCTSTASTYAAALAAAVSARGSSERTERLVRGPLAMPLHVLAASTSSYALPSSASNVGLKKSITSSPLPTHPFTAPSVLTSTTDTSSLEQQSIPGQVTDELSLCTTTLMTVPSSHSHRCEPQYTTTLKFPESSMLSSAYSGSSSTLSPNSIVGSTSFTTPSISNSASKYEPELLLSPAKLGQ